MEDNMSVKVGVNFKNQIAQDILKTISKIDLIEVPDNEYESMGCNVLAVAPREVLMLSGNPITEQSLIDAGVAVHLYDGSEISIKGAGGPTCLTRPFLRE